MLETAPKESQLTIVERISDEMPFVQRRDLRVVLDIELFGSPVLDARSGIAVF